MKIRDTEGPAVDPAIVAFLEDGELSGDYDLNAWETAYNLTALRAAWRTAGPAIVANWITRRPGERPAAWWWFSAPEPTRRRLGGIGDDHAAAGWQQNYDFGLPRCWFDPWLCAYYRGEATDVHGRPVGEEYRDQVPRWPHVGIDPDDPPRFESQAAFLARHGLLSEAERRRLPDGAFEPELITFDEGDS